MLTALALLFALPAASARASTGPVVPLDLGTLEGDYSQPFEVNAAGQVVGSSTTANNEWHAFPWTKDGGMVDLGTPSRHRFQCHISLADSGQVVGYSTTATGQPHAFLWTSEDGMVGLGTLGGSSSLAYDVNASGEVVGSSTTANNDTHAFSWTKDGGMVDLHPPGKNHARAEAVNDNTQVVLTVRPRHVPRRTLSSGRRMAASILTPLAARSAFRAT